METKHTYQRTPLKRYSGYQIDVNGDVWSLLGWRGIKEKQLIPHPNKYGYLRVTLKTNNGRKTEFIHNLMVENFIGDKEGLQVRHLDGNKKNNNLYNLKLGTAKENAADRELHGKTVSGESHSELIQLRKENAKLKRELAAAPDLLESLIEAIEYFKTDTSNGVELNPKWKHKAINAIKKATE